MKHFLASESRLILTPAPGSEVSRAVREAIIIALTEDRAVEFKFNNHPFLIDPDVIVNNALATYPNRN